MNDPQAQDSQGGFIIDPQLVLTLIIVFMLYFDRNTNQALVSFLEVPIVANRKFANHHRIDPSKGICSEHSNPG